MNWASIDPGAVRSGISIWDCDGRHKHTGDIMYAGAKDYCHLIDAIILNYKLYFAVIENFYFYRTGHGKNISAYKVIGRIETMQECFEHYIMLHHNQWNPHKAGDAVKKSLCIQAAGRAFSNEEQRDSYLIGEKVWQTVQMVAGADTFFRLMQLSQKQRKWPTANEPRPWLTKE